VTIPNSTFFSRVALVSSFVLTTAFGAYAQDTDEDEKMRKMTEGVLAGLGVKPTTPPPAETDPEMRNLTDSVLSALGADTEHSTESGDEKNLSELVSSALLEGRSDNYISALLEEAVVTGEIVVPNELRSASGSVDTDQFVALLKATALSQGTEIPTALTSEAASLAQGPVQASFPFVPHMQLTKSGGKHYYKVLPLDNLGGIALRAYGDASLYPVIFAANPDRLTDPDRIYAGQRLYIPRPDV